MAEKIAWGIIGTGNIANQFATGVAACRRGRLAAVGSRSAASAEAFARKFHIPAAVAGYDAVLADPNVTAVYNSLPNSMHHEWTIKALRAGKHVLCEKPFAIDVAQSREMFDVARQTGRVLMEAFMYRCHPMMVAVQQVVAEGAIGQVRMIRSSFCYFTGKTDGNVRFQPELAGGGLMDVGCYCISFSRLFAGQEPSKIHVVAHKHASGVDDIAAGDLLFPDGVVASFTCGMSVHAPNPAFICGSAGYIEIPIPWKPPTQGAQFTISRSIPPRMDGGKPAGPPPRETRTVDAGMDLYGIEADDFASAVLDGTPPRISPQETLGNMRVLEEMRKQLP